MSCGCGCGYCRGAVRAVTVRPHADAQLTVTLYPIHWELYGQVWNIWWSPSGRDGTWVLANRGPLPIPLSMTVYVGYIAATVDGDDPRFSALKFTEGTGFTVDFDTQRITGGYDPTIFPSPAPSGGTVEHPTFANAAEAQGWYDQEAEFFYEGLINEAQWRDAQAWYQIELARLGAHPPPGAPRPPRKGVTMPTWVWYAGGASLGGVLVVLFARGMSRTYDRATRAVDRGARAGAGRY